MPALISARSLTRTFKEVRALDDLTLDIHQGEIFGIVGPDGAGKTTTLRLFAGLLNISGGDLMVAGSDMHRHAEAVKRKIGYMAQQFSLYRELTVIENLEFFADVFDVGADQRKQRIARLLAFARLEQFRDRRSEHLSGGMQKKLALACTLIHEPQILLLDEPTTGVDPISRREFWEILTDLHVQGSTIVVSTPYMDEAERCSTVALLYRGKLLLSESPEAIRGRLEGDFLLLRPIDWRAVKRMAVGLPGVQEIQSYGETLYLRVDSAAERMPQLRKALGDRGLEFYELRQTTPRMEEAFISLTRNLEN